MRLRQLLQWTVMVGLATCAWLPTDPCPADPVQFCTSNCFDASQLACANTALVPPGASCRLSTACNVSQVACMNTCISLITPCTLFATPELCVLRMSALTGCMADAISSACATVYPRVKALLLCAVCPTVATATRIWEQRSGVAVTVVNDDNNGQYLQDAMSIVGSSYKFDTIIGLDQLVDILSVTFPMKTFISYNPMSIDRPNVRSLVFDAGPLGYLTCCACGLATVTGHIGAYSYGLPALNRQALIGCIAALKDVCPNCTLHSYTNTSAVRDPRIDTLVLSTWIETAVIDLKNITFLAQQVDKVVDTNIPNVIFSPLTVIPSAFFAPFSATSVLVDHSWTAFKISQALPFAEQLQNLYLRLVESFYFDYGAVALDKLANRTANQITKSRDFQPVRMNMIDRKAMNNGSVLQLSETVFVRFTLFVPSEIWVFLAGINVGVSGTVDSSRLPWPRSRAALTSPTSMLAQPPSLVAYLVFGLNASNSKRLGDIWKLESQVGDVVFYRWSLFYTLETDTALVLPVERYGHTATVVDDVIYVFGGVTRDIVRPLPVTNELWTFNLTSQVWQQLDGSGLTARAFHRAVFMQTSSVATLASGVFGKRFIFFAFGTLDRATAPAVSVLSLDTFVGASFLMPLRADGTPVFANSSGNTNLCFAARTDYIYVLGVSLNTTSNYTVCKYNALTSNKGWGCQDVTDVVYSYASIRPFNCMLFVDSLIAERTSFLFLNDDGASVLTDIPIHCDYDDDIVPSALQWECLPCPAGYEAINGVCVSCSINASGCEETMSESRDSAFVIPVSVSLVVASIFVSASVIIIVYRRSQRKKQRASNTDELVKDAVTAIATGYLEPVEYLYKMPRPTRLQRSLLSILQIFDVYAQFMPGWVFRGDRQAHDFDNVASFPGVSLSSAVEPPHNWRHLRSRLGLHGNVVEASFSQSILSESNNRELSNNRHTADAQSSKYSYSVSVENDELKTMLYHPRLVENNFYNADCTIMCLSFRLDWSLEATLVSNFDELLTRVYNIIDDAMGLIHSLVGDRLTVTFNGLIANESHARDACTAACIIASTLAEKVPDVPPVQIGLSRGYVKVGIVSTSTKLLSAVIGDALERAQELLVANNTMNTNILCDWPLAAFLGSAFAIRLIGYWRRSTTHKYLIAELKGMAQNEDAAVSVQVSLKAQNDGSSVLICSSDFAPLNELMIAIERKDDRQRDILIQKCRMTRRVPESTIKYLIRHNTLMVYSQEAWPAEGPVSLTSL